MKKRLIKILGYYLISVLGFATIYWIIWQNNTANYVINDQINQTTYNTSDLVFNLEERPEIDTVMPISITEFNKTINLMKIELKRKRIELDSLSKIQLEKETHRDSIGIYLNSDLNKRMDIIINQNIQLLTDSLKLYDRLIDILLEYPDNKPNIESVNRLKGQKSNLEYEISRKRAKNRNYVDNNMLMFFDKESLYEYDKLDTIINALNIEITLLRNDTSSIRSDLYEAKQRFHNNRKQYIGFADFLYFSLLTSTCTSFSDIIPNTWVVRLIIFLQIISSLIFIGCLVNHIYDQLKNK